MILTLTIIGLAFIWLGYETDWMRVRLLVGVSTPVASSHPTITLVHWLEAFKGFGIKNLDFKALPDYSGEARPKTGYAVLRTFLKQYTYPEIYTIYLSPNTDTLVSRQWLDKHWADLEDYHPTVELYFGNGYRQTFTLKKPELIKQIIKINAGKKYFKQLATQVV